MKCVLALVLATIASAQEWTPVPPVLQDGLAAEGWREALAAAREQPSPENVREALYAAALVLGDRGNSADRRQRGPEPKRESGARNSGTRPT